MSDDTLTIPRGGYQPLTNHQGKTADLHDLEFNTA